MNLRPYQQHILAQVAKGWSDYRKQLVIAPTGSGKTIMFSNLAKTEAEQGGRTLVLVDQTELVWQALDKLQRATGISGEAEKAELRASRSTPVVVSTIQSMSRRLAEWPADHFSLVIADEADKSISDSWQGTLHHFDPHARVCGFTATPNRTDQRNLGEYYDNIAAEVGLFDLIDQGYLSPIAVQTLPIQIDLKSVRVSNGDFDANDLADAISPYLRAVADAIKQHARERKIMVFLPLVKTSQKFVEICRSVGLSAEHIDGESPDRAEKLQRFSDWEFDILSNSSLLTRGYDEPAVDCIIMLRPTKSLTLFMQCIGRGTRIDTLKRNLLLLDCLWLSEKYRSHICRPAHLIAKTEEEADAITELAEKQSAALPADVAAQVPLDLQELAGTATKQREESLRKRLEEQKHKKGKFISAEEFALQHHNLDAAEYEPLVKWQKDPITDSQLKWLKRAHIDPATVRGKGHASVLLGVYFGSQKLQLASPKQRAKMRQMGHANPDMATAGEARRFFAELRTK